MAAKRTFTSPGPWPLVRLVSGVVNELLGWRPKERSPSLAPGPLVFTVWLSYLPYRLPRHIHSHSYPCSSDSHPRLSHVIILTHVVHERREVCGKRTSRAHSVMHSKESPPSIKPLARVHTRSCEHYVRVSNLVCSARSVFQSAQWMQVRALVGP